MWVLVFARDDCHNTFRQQIPTNVTSALRDTIDRQILFAPSTTKYAAWAEQAKLPRRAGGGGYDLDHEGNLLN